MKTKIVMLTGFLGAGKTTFLSALLDEYRDQRIGIIVNEFGEISIDGPLLERDGILMRELANGSIFCACIKENFLGSLIAMSYEPLDYLFIEASGLADPSSMDMILQAIASKVKNEYAYLGSICIVDGETFLDYYELLPALHRQVAYCGAVIVNKADLTDDETLTKVLEKLKEINPKARLHVTSYCKVCYKEITESLTESKLPAEESTNTVENRPKTFILRADTAVQAEEFLTFLNEISEYSYRIKGFVQTTTGNIAVSAVRHHVEWTSWDKPIEKTEIAVISAIGIRLVSVITSKLKGKFNGVVHL